MGKFIWCLTLVVLVVYCILQLQMDTGQSSLSWSSLRQEEPANPVRFHHQAALTQRAPSVNWNGNQNRNEAALPDQAAIGNVSCNQVFERKVWFRTRKVDWVISGGGGK